MFQFPGLALLAECYTFSITGCPIRKSSDITLVCSSPKLIAAYHVLHRLLVPRHPPYALIRFKYRSVTYHYLLLIVISLLLQFVQNCFPNMSKNFENNQLLPFSTKKKATILLSSLVDVMDSNHTAQPNLLHL